LASPLVLLENVSVAYRRGVAWRKSGPPVIRSVDLAVKRGETLGLVGESGAGKSTIARVMLGLLKPTQGRASFDDIELPASRRRLRGRMEVVLQHPAWSINPALRVGTAVVEPLRMAKGSARRERIAALHGVLESVGLNPALADRYSHELSGGQLQRVALARALITEPEFIVFDEAVSALDMSVQAQVLNLIRDLQHERGFAAAFVSHDLSAVRYVADRIAVVYDGKVVEQASAADFYGTPTHPYSRALQEACVVDAMT
jgi:ABC-type glutathione transport system ATPase component